MKEKFKVALVGCGGIAQVHTKVLSQMDNVEIIAFCDIKKERADALCQKYGGKIYTDFDEMIENETIDIMHICTPHYLHTPMAKACSEKNIKVFTEKPPVISYQQWEDFSSIKTSLGICFQNRYNKNILKMKELIQNGETGKILGARAFVTWTRDEKYYSESGWRGAISTEGGGVLINQSIHTLDLLVYLIGTPISCQASCANRHLQDVIEVEDTLEAYVKFTGENTSEHTSALFYATTAYSTDSPVLIELHCENMTMKAEGEQLFITDKNGKTTVENFAKESSMGKSYWGTGHFACIFEFYKAIENNEKAPIGIPEIENTTKLMLDIYQKARGI